MWVHRGSLEHPLSPADYGTPESTAADLDALRTTWQLVGVRAELGQPGDYVERNVLGLSLIVWRGRQDVAVFRNACAHRHTALVAAGSRGRADTVTCPYHGWMYGSDGRCRAIPDLASFGNQTPSRFGLARCPHRWVGDLLFASLVERPVPMAARTEALAEKEFDQLRVIGGWELEHTCDWKIPIENVLETYHVPSLHQNVLARHPRLFRLFERTTDPRSVASGEPVHELGQGFSEYRDRVGASSTAYRAWLRHQCPTASTAYVHHHAMPNTVLAQTGVVAFAQSAWPIRAGRCRQRLWLLSTAVRRSGASGLAQRAVERAMVALMDRIVREDASIYDAVAAGQRASCHAGLLSAREERVHAFQRDLLVRRRGASDS